MIPSQNKPKPSMPMPNPMGYQPSFAANGQAVNAGAALQGFRRDSQVAPKTGTPTGDRAVTDFARGQQLQGQANLGRQLANQNAAAHSKMQAQKQQLTQQGRAARLQRYQQMVGQSVDQMNLANRLAQQQLDMQTQWRTAMIGLLS